MNNYLSFKLYLIVLILSGVTMLANAQDISIQPSTTNANQGSIFVLDINVSNVVDLYAIQFDLTYDPTILAFDNINKSTFLFGANGDLFISGNDDGNGRISNIGLTLLGAVPGVTGNGTVIQLDLKATTPGNSTINLENIILLDSIGNIIAPVISNGNVNVKNITPPTPVPIFSVWGWSFLIFSLIFIVIFWQPRKISRNKLEEY